MGKRNEPILTIEEEDLVFYNQKEIGDYFGVTKGLVSQLFKNMEIIKRCVIT